MLFSGGGHPPVQHRRDVGELAVGADGNLPEVVLGDRESGAHLEPSQVNHRDRLRPAVAHDQLRPVGSQGQAARFATDGDPAGHLTFVRSTRTTSLLAPTATYPVAPSPRSPPPRFGPDFDPPLDRELVIGQVEDRDVIAVPMRDQRHAGRRAKSPPRSAGRRWPFRGSPASSTGSTSETDPAVWLATSSLDPSGATASAIGDRSTSSARVAAESHRHSSSSAKHQTSARSQAMQHGRLGSRAVDRGGRKVQVTVQRWVERSVGFRIVRSYVSVARIGKRNQESSVGNLAVRPTILPYREAQLHDNSTTKA